MTYCVCPSIEYAMDVLKHGLEYKPDPPTKSPEENRSAISRYEKAKAEIKIASATTYGKFGRERE